MAHRSRRALNTNPGEDPSKLSSEVLKLRLQALNLPITGSKGHPLSRLKRATQGNAAAQRRKPQKRLSQPKTRRGRSAQRTAIESQPPGEAENHRRKQNVPSSLEHKQEDSTLSDRASLSSIEEMLETDIPSRTSQLYQVSNRTPASVLSSVQQSKLSCHNRCTLHSPRSEHHPQQLQAPSLLAWLLLWVSQGQ